MPCLPGCNKEILPPSPSCKIACKDCEWESDVTSMGGPSSCTFTWEIRRRKCRAQSDGTWNGVTVVACGQSTVIEKNCDGAGNCPAYRLTFTCTCD